MDSDERAFEVFVSYHIAPQGGGMVKFGNIFISIGVKRSKSGYLPENLTGQMVVQVRAQIAVAEKCDEEAIYIANVLPIETPPEVEQEKGESSDGKEDM